MTFTWRTLLPSFFLVLAMQSCGDSGGADGDGDGTGTTGDDGGGDGDGGTSTGDDGGTGGTGGGGGTGSGSGDDGGGGTGTATDTGGDGGTGTGDTGGTGGCVVRDCQGEVYECGDCQENDSDGLIDSADPECVSPCDDDESSFATGLPGDNKDCKQDCFFDGNSGQSTDECWYDARCDPEREGADTCPYSESRTQCDNFDSCDPSTCPAPNGCDCFGCCTITVDGTDHDVWLGDPDCSSNNIDQCDTCTKSTDCGNDCEPEKCEICFGETEPPEGCDEGTCDEGFETCEVHDDGTDTCPSDQFCRDGCCTIVPQ